jgi:proline dehydrogenase
MEWLLFKGDLMLRSFLIYLSKASWAQRIISGWKIARNAASRFIAGENIDDAIRAVKELNKKGIYATLDHLGEHTKNSDAAEKATRDIKEILVALQKSDVLANVSIKLTQIGLSLDEELCKRNLLDILTLAQANGNFIRIDMEDTPYTDKTIRLYRFLKSAGYQQNSGIVLQSYLYRTIGDVRKLLAEGAKIRLVKGAYKEPADLAYPKKADVNSNFDEITKLMVNATIQNTDSLGRIAGRIPPIAALGTHDESRINFCKQYVSSMGLPKDAIEFQMLYGIRRDLQENLTHDGYPVRVYVPYGAQWYPYYMRRLAERPANIWFFVSNFFRR